MKSMLLLAALAAAHAQSPSFEAVSIRISPPGTRNPGMWIRARVAKNGPKFSGPEPPKDASPDAPRPPVLGNRARGQWLRAPIQKLATELDYQLGKPVVEATGLGGKYDLHLYWVPETTPPDAGGPTPFGAN
jgi:hypothetical protein